MAADALATGKLQGIEGFGPTGSGIDGTRFRGARGTLAALMLGVDFPDAPGVEAPEPYRTVEAHAAFLAPGARRWFQDASYGRLDLEVQVVPGWHRLGSGHETYGFTRGIDAAAHGAYIQEAVRLATGQVPWDQFDVVYIVAAANARGITFSPAFIRSDPARAPQVDGHAITHAVTFGQDMWRWGFKVLNHETLHELGLPDLYAYQPEDPQNPHPYVGGWDVMGLISGHAPDLFAWQKWRLGWIDDGAVTVVPPSRTVRTTLTCLEHRGGTKLVVIPDSPHSGLCLESRRACGLDAGMRAEGVVAYRVDASIRGGHGPIRLAWPEGTPPASDKDHAVLTQGTHRFTLADGDAVTVSITRANWQDALTLERDRGRRAPAGRLAPALGSACHRE